MGVKGVVDCNISNFVGILHPSFPGSARKIWRRGFSLWPAGKSLTIGRSVTTIARCCWKPLSRKSASRAPVTRRPTGKASGTLGEKVNWAKEKARSPSSRSGFTPSARIFAGSCSRWRRESRQAGNHRRAGRGLAGPCQERHDGRRFPYHQGTGRHPPASPAGGARKSNLHPALVTDDFRRQDRKNHQSPGKQGTPSREKAGKRSWENRCRSLSRRCSATYSRRFQILFIGSVRNASSIEYTSTLHSICRITSITRCERSPYSA